VTSIAVWAGVDTHGVTSLYIASDSRITWGKAYTWDQGRKIFVSSSFPHIFGYWGDVLFPALALPVLIDRVDRGLLKEGDSGWQENIEQAVRRLWSNYPVPERRDLGVVHGFRSGDGTKCTFKFAILTYEALTDTWDTRVVPMPSMSSILHIAGSGSQSVRRAHKLWQASGAMGTSRAVFSAFCESICSGIDQKTGGPAQLAGLYRIGSGRLFGFVRNNQRYFAGATLIGGEHAESVEWRNDLFERVDGVTKLRIQGAQKHRKRTNNSE
jgi:hypothetical protein